MSTHSPRPLLPTLIPSLNALLAALDLPFTVDHPTDLTPSLLLAIFESLISARLPVPTAIRQSRTRDAKARAMLVLLGVLECDILRGGTDANPDHSVATSNVDDSVLAGAGGVSVDGWIDEIGLGEVDPERLADGGWDETIFIGELLCWLARRKRILPRIRSSHRISHSRSLYSNYHSYGDEGNSADFSTSLLLRPSPGQNTRSPRPQSPSPSVPETDPDFSILSHITDVPRHPLVQSPEPSMSASATTGTDLSIRARSVSSRTTMSNLNDDPDQFEEASQDTVQQYDPVQMMQDAEEDDDRPPSFHPRCIHELEDPSYIRALASFDASTSLQHIPEDAPSRDADEQDNDDPYAPQTPTPRRVRLTGWIEPVDPTIELSQFAASRSQTRSRASNSNIGSGSGTGPPPASQKFMRPDALPNTFLRRTAAVSPNLHLGPGNSHTPRRVSRSPTPSPSPSPPPSTSALKYVSAPPRPSLSPSPSPSPSPPPSHSDAPFDVSFSTLNNTSTPAKPRSSRRPQTQLQTRTTGRSHTERSPAYIPPSLATTPGSLRGTASGSTPESGTRPRAPVSMPPSVAMEKRTWRASSPPSSRARAKEPMSTPISPVPGSTATTSSLLTERARLLTELAALKRARALSSGGSVGVESGTTAGMGSRTGAGTGTGMRTGSSEAIGRRVGVGV